MLIVTIAALVMAASLGWFVFRLLRDEQRRADARVAALTAAIDGDDTSGWDTPVRAGHVGFKSPRAARPPVPTTPPTPVQAPTPGSAAPDVPELVFLEDEITSGRDFVSEHADWMKAAPAPGARASAAPTLPDTSALIDSVGEFESTSLRTAGLFGESPEPPRRSGFAIVMLVVLLAAFLAVAYTWLSSSTPAPTTAGAEHAPPATAAATVGIPLELVSLAHERHKGALVVRGVVRNPVSGSNRDDLVASVMLLDAAGGVLGSGRAPLRAPQLRPGQETAFTVELPSHADVRRYRVTFRAPDGSLVAHADRRARAASTTSS
jgi:hypothetical protein